MNREELNSTFNDLIPAFGNFINAIKLLIDEEKRLEAENDGLKSQLDFEIMNKETLVYNCEKFQEGNIKLKQALEEVREITKKYYLSDKKLLATGIEINPYGAIIEIQEKINEVLGD